MSPNQNENPNQQMQSMALDSETSQPTIPTDIVVRILLRLPVESLLRCKSVCKSWHSLISNPRFIKSHLAMSTTNTDYAHHTLIYTTEYFPSVRGRPIIKLKTCNLRDVLYDSNNNSINNALEVDYPSKHESNSVSIVGSCNGLVCIAVEEYVMSKALFIWNPSTRKSYRLPPSGCKPIGWYVVCGFGYDESTDEYKVVALSPNLIDGEALVRIYSLKDGNWKEIVVAYSHGFPSPEFGKLCINGVLRWPASTGHGSASCSMTITSFDLVNETCGEVLQPVYDAGRKDLRLGSLKEWLCVLCSYCGIRADVWVMKDYGVKDSWTKLVSIPYLNVPWRDHPSTPLCVSDDGERLLQIRRDRLIVYDSKNNSDTEIQKLDICIGACTFVESLVSPMPAASLGDI
ncbi:F-box/kelch-repeat protein At3g23880-like isoform X1 [Bidens hawaiensis]|uniref:F-box/kelch-repeat protein At3g23880-like isoform X1 n=1 Tax=Bidens hawaiensis TaxID=980011 RepID=UPI00404A409B